MLPLLGLITLGVVAITGCGTSNSTAAAPVVPSPSAPQASMCTPGPGITQTTKTASFLLVLDVGSPEKMYTPAQVQAQHPTDGEVMLSGRMATMNNPADPQHLEVHICTRTSGQVTSGVQPVITLIDESGNHLTQHIPTLVMQGITAGAGDLHYGNIVNMPPAHQFTITVAVTGETATFHLMTAKS